MIIDGNDSRDQSTAAGNVNVSLCIIADPNDRSVSSFNPIGDCNTQKSKGLLEKPRASLLRPGVPCFERQEFPVPEIQRERVMVEIAIETGVIREVPQSASIRIQ